MRETTFHLIILGGFVTVCLGGLLAMFGLYQGVAVGLVGLIIIVGGFIFDATSES